MLRKNFQVAKNRRKEAVLEREKNYLSPQKQLEHLDSLGLVAIKERAKIAKRLNNE